MARVTKDLKLEYIRSLYAQEDEVLARVRRSIPQGKEGMVVGAEEGKLLCILMQIIGAKRVLEIGTFVGYSSIWLARGLERGGTIFSIEKHRESYELAKQNISNSDVVDKVSLLYGDAADVLRNFEWGGLFDAIFIDADKANYDLYLNLCLNHLRDGGLIIADNTLLFDTIYGQEPTEDQKLLPMWRGITKFNNALSNRKLFQSIMIPTKEGFSIAIKKA